MTDLPVVPVSWGELIDKLTILEIKSTRLTDPSQLVHVHTELACLRQAAVNRVGDVRELPRLQAALKELNASLWQVEDEIRACEGQQDFGPRFIELARSVYRYNDQRAELKRRINTLLGAAFSEQKSYTRYEANQ